MQPVKDLNLVAGSLLEWQVGTPPSIVLEVGKDSILVLTPELDVVTIRYGEGNWGRVVSDTKSAPVVGIMLNEESGVSHKVVNGKTLCGAGFTQKSTFIVSGGIVTCERCNKGTRYGDSE